ncbi:hypothetical protein CA13_11540 [Planctomycetes bacterium CA13]|uniref:EGF-like domain-containing protein n=1 Tax=Novipirellula herctigrandis TaxID=2527986 RepID=A0A5C5YYT4_9BACT|nr:hypothetical protein CA13_11540 [Planctomycetes bacterium CA13]
MRDRFVSFLATLGLSLIFAAMVPALSAFADVGGDGCTDTSKCVNQKISNQNYCATGSKCSGRKSGSDCYCNVRSGQPCNCDI